MEEILDEIVGTEAPLVWKINDVDFIDYGVYVSASKNLMEALEMKDPEVEKWAGQHGEFLDLTAPRYEARVIELECFLAGQGKLDFFNKVRAFVQAIQKKGLQKFTVETSDKPLIFMVVMQNSMDLDKKWNEEEMVGTFSITLREPQPIKRLLRYEHTGDGSIDNSGIDATWNAVTFGNGVFVAVANSGVTYVMTSTNGILWTARLAAATSDWYAVTFGAGKFVAVASNGTQNVMTSTDGITWSLQTAANGNSWNGICYGAGLFVAISYDGTLNQVMTSPDGVTWTARVTPENNQWRSIVFANGLFVAVADSGTHRVMTSPDGITWTTRTASAASEWYSITFGNSTFVAVAYSGSTRVMTSPDGITWTSRTAPAQSWASVTYGKGLFVAVGFSGSGNRVMTSPDGVTWTNRTSTEDNNFRSVVLGNGKFVAVARDGTHRVMSSSDGIDWIDNSTQPFELSFNSPNAVNIFWGDGLIDYDVYGEAVVNHEYEEEGVYYILIAGVIEEITDFVTTAEIIWNKY